MKKLLISIMVSSLIACAFTGCFEKKKTAAAAPVAEESVEINTVSFDEGVAMAAANPGSIIVDVRRDDEFATGHLPGAINFARENINEETAPAILPDKNQMIFVHCRSGGRSKMAAKTLIELGYTNIIDMGGIMNYTGELEK